MSDALNIHVDGTVFMNASEMAHHVREIERLKHEKKVANKDWNESIKEHQQILNELAHHNEGGK